MRPARSGKPMWRLSEVVYWRTHAVPGEQIHERSGGMILVMRTGALHPIRLSMPEPLLLETVFTHTAHAIQSDHSIVQHLLAEGILAEGPPRVCNGRMTRSPNQLLSKDHPLIVDKPPAELLSNNSDQPQRTPRNRKFGWS
jgi:hypothetical protein